MSRLSEEDKKIIVEEKLKGTVSRKIGEMLGRGKSTINDYWNKWVKDEEVAVSKDGPKILLYDLETSMIKAYVWGLFKQDININSIVEDWYVICWSAKWLGTDEMINASVHNDFGEGKPLSGRYRDNERYIIEKLWVLINDADYIIAYNGKSFDRKKMNAKFLEYGLPVPSPYKIIDPLLICKGNFAITSNKMDFVSKYVDDLEKGKLPTGLGLWHRCMDDDEEALDRMQEYCDEDINVLERVYLAVRHWDKNSPNMALHYSDDKPRCNGCGSDNLVEVPNKVHTTTLSKFPIVKCGDCGKLLRTRENLLSKDKKKSLLMNAG